jgi:DNA-binding NarL/FixJ family response regulator
MTRIKLLLIDDHILFREGLRALISTTRDLEVVGEASEARAAYKLAEELSPDVALLDLTLPGTGGVAVTRELRRRAPDTRVLILTMHTTQDYVVQSMAAGAIGYALKDQPAATLFDAIRQVARGVSYLSPRFPRALLDGTGDGGPLGALSDREREIFDLVVRGFSTQAIAGELCIAKKTVETHRGNINKKLGAHSTADLLRLAARYGLLATVP